VIFNIWTGSLRSVPQGMAWRMPWIMQPLKGAAK